MLSSTEGSLSMQPREQGDTGVDVGSNETARTSADAGRPGRLRGRCLAARGLTAGLLVAVAGLLALPLQAQAQTKILVSNVGHRSCSGKRFSHRLRPGASIHHGQQQRRLHAEKCRNRYRQFNPT